MLNSVYTAGSGLQSFSKGLDVISSNVTNVNTFGYKSSSLLYEDVHYQFNLGNGQQYTMYGANIGAGVDANLTSVRFSAGDLRQTGNDTDIAITGKGFFIVDSDGEYLYTRNGQFTFDNDGDLATLADGYKVMGLSEGGELHRINRNAFRTQPAAPTSSVSLVGNLSTGSTAATISNVTIIDTLGASHTFTVRLTADSTTPRTWLVSIADENNLPVGAGGTIAFQDNGSPAEGANSYTFTFQASNAAAQDISLEFGAPGSFSSVTSFSGGSASNVVMSTQNGHAAGELLGLSFNEKGQMIAKYSNDESDTGPQLALAAFDNLQALMQIDGGLFRPQENQEPIVGSPTKDGLGRVTGGSLESSNVDLSQQFSDMIIIQRGYQASSQMLTVANEMMQQLLEMNKR